MSEDLLHAGSMDDLFHILHRAEQRAKILFAEEARGLDLTVRQHVILNAVAAQDDMMQTDIVSHTGIDRSTVTELIGRMVKRGLLQRQRNRRDARAYMIQITDEGRARLAAAEEAAKKAGERFLEMVPMESRDCFVRVLGSLAQVDDDASVVA